MGPSSFLRRPSGRGTVVGLIGDPVSHSLSPLMHNRAFHALGMDWVYVPFQVGSGRLAEALAGLSALNIRGVNVTIPHKEAVVPFLDECTPRGRAAGAVNTITIEDGRLIGDNTDGIGFVRALRDEATFDPKGARVFLYGAGGAARAIATALADAGAKRLFIVNRTQARGEQLALHLQKLGVDAQATGWDGPQVEAELQASHLLVQTTPAGMAGLSNNTQGMVRHGTTAGLPPPLRPEWLHPKLVVADIVYTPRKTALVRAARLQGAKVVPGWGMLLYQGAEAFAQWTGQAAPIPVMRAALLEALCDSS